MIIQTTSRKINFFEIVPEYLEGQAISNFGEIFTAIKKLSLKKDASRFVYCNEKMLYIKDIVFDPKEKKLKGKLLNIRTDVFPELINTIDDNIRDIEATKEDGVVETSHFVLSYTKDPIHLALEFNQYGPRVSDFIFYVNSFSFSKTILENLTFQPFIREDLPAYKKRMNKISLVYAKVHKDNVKRINEFDKELFDAFETAEKVSEAEYVTLTLKYDYHNQGTTSKIRTKILHIIDKFITDKTMIHVFNTLKVKAEDAERNDKLKEFDLLNIFIKSEISVQRKENSRSLVSADIFEKIEKELHKEFKR